MTATETNPGDPNAENRPAWLQLLDDNLARFSETNAEVDFDHHLARATKKYLLCDDADAAVKFARLFDDMYAAVYEPKFNGYNQTKKGWTGYLIGFYDNLLHTAVAMRYDDPLQDKVIQLLVELRKLPPHADKIFVVSPFHNSQENPVRDANKLHTAPQQPEFAWLDCEIWVRDPLFPWQLLKSEPIERKSPLTTLVAVL